MPKCLSESGKSTQIILRIPPELDAALKSLQAALTTPVLGAPKWSTVVRRCLEVGCEKLGEAAGKKAATVDSKPAVKGKARKAPKKKAAKAPTIAEAKAQEESMRIDTSDVNAAMAAIVAAAEDQAVAATRIEPVQLTPVELTPADVKVLGTFEGTPDEIGAAVSEALAAAEPTP